MSFLVSADPWAEPVAPPSPKALPAHLTPVSSGGLVDIPVLIAKGLKLYDGGGMPRGTSTGWPALDPYYTVGLGQFTLITGIPGSGKSEWLDAMLVNLAEADESWEFAMYSPENYPSEGHLVKLVEKRVRKPFNAGPTPRMTQDEYLDAAAWVAQHFFWIEPDLRSPIGLADTARKHKRRGKKLGVVLDPWNTLDHERNGMSETDYVSLVLTEVTRFVAAHDAHIFLVAHPTKLMRDKNGARPIPTPYDISGSAHWFNKSYNIICVHRDKDESCQDVAILIQKVKFKWMGKVGEVVLKYDRITGRYFEPMPGTVGAKELYADPERRS